MNNMENNLSAEETTVLQLITAADKRITQLQIARSAQWLGSHPEHEKDLNINHEQTTLRKIRQIIRNLRVEKECLILSDKKGYWLIKEPWEATEYIQRIEKMAKAQARAWFETYRAMQKNFNNSIHSDYFDKQGKLF